MNQFKSLLSWSVLLLVMLVGFWMAIVNDSPIQLNLLFTETGPLNSGFVLFVSNLIGLLIGFGVGFATAKFGSWRKSKHEAPTKALKPLDPKP